MKLETFLKQENLSASRFAEAVSVKPQTVYRWLSRERLPDDSSMAKIFEATSGEVAPNDFYDLPELADQEIRR